MKIDKEILLNAEKTIRTKYADFAEEDVLQHIIGEFKVIFKKKTGEPFPQDIKTQLLNTICACMDSWNTEKAKNFRIVGNIPDDLGCAITIQAMVFGNYNTASGVGIAHSRNLVTGDNEIDGAFLREEQDSSLLEKKHTYVLSEMNETMKATYVTVDNILKTLEKENKDVMSINYCVQDEKLWLISMWEAEQTPEARVKSVTEMAINQIITNEE